MRLAGQIKCGYYPTPTEVVERIGTWLSFPQGPVTMLDPCCGEGTALAQLAQGTKATTYGVEIDAERAAIATTRLNRVLHGGIEETRISNSVCSLLWLNPPYDDEHQSQDADRKTERKERSFLRETIRYLMPGGALVYIIPCHRLDQHVASILSYRFERLSVFRFPGTLYDDFKQLVIIGTKKRVPEANPQALQQLVLLAPHRPELRPASATQPIYAVPPAKPIELFRSLKVDLATVAQQVTASSLWTHLYDVHRNVAAELRRPPIALHQGHIALLLASGFCNGVIGDGSERHLVKGHVRKVKSVSVEYEEHGDDMVAVTKERDQFQVIVRVLQPDGSLRTLH